MRQLPSLVIACAIAALAVAPPARAQTRPVTLADLLAVRQVSDPMLAPDGRAIVYAVRGWEDQTGKDAGRKESRTHLWLVNADGTGQRQITYGERGESAPAWSPDGRFISFLSARGAADADDGPHTQIWLMRTDGGEAWRLTDAAESVTAYAWSPDGSTIAFVSKDPLSKEVRARRKQRADERLFEGDFQMAHVWVVGVAGAAAGGAREIVHDPHLTVRGAPTWSADSRRLAFSASPTPLVRDSRADVYIATLGGGLEKISTNQGPDTEPAWSPDGSTIAYLSVPADGSPLGDGFPLDSLRLDHLVLYDVTTKQTSDRSSASFDLSPRHPFWSADSRQVFFDAGVRTASDVFEYDPASRRYAPITHGRVAHVGSVGRAGLGLVMESSSEPPEIYLLPASTSGRGSPAGRLTDNNPQSHGFALGRTRVVSWKSDGYTIEGVLLEPVGYQEGRRYPLLVVPHGGPTGAYVDGYRVGYGDGGQNWAGEGWAVLYPNPRGSTNYGEAFERANIDDWGGGDYRDIMAGVDALIARGVADPARLAILGWSYGGYMTCWTITQTPRFKAAMIGAGLTDLVSMYGTNDSSNYLGAFFGGIPGPNTMALYEARSGLTFVDRVQTPVLILHGASDERVPVGQPMEFYRALRDRGKQAALVFYPREGHGFREYYHQLDRLERQHAWITRYTLGDSARGTSHP